MSPSVLLKWMHGQITCDLPGIAALNMQSVFLGLRRAWSAVDRQAQTASCSPSVCKNHWVPDYISRMLSQARTLFACNLMLSSAALQSPAEPIRQRFADLVLQHRSELPAARQGLGHARLACVQDVLCLLLSAGYLLVQVMLCLAAVRPPAMLSPAWVTWQPAMRPQTA